MCDHLNREEAMVSVASDVWCDPCLAGLVAALNAAGLPTVASCCGHGRRPSNVALADGRFVVLLDSSDFSRIGGLWLGINDEPAQIAGWSP